MLEQPGPVELPTDVARRVAQLPSPERALVVVLSRVLDDAALDAYVGLLDPYRESAAVTTFDGLAEGADRAERDDLALGLAKHFDRFRLQHASEMEIVDRSLRRGASKQKTVDEAVRELYNSAQRDVLHRLHTFLPSENRDQRQRPGPQQPKLRSSSGQLGVPA